MKKWVKWFIGIIAILVVAGGVFLAKYLIDVNNYQDAVANMTYQNVDASGVPDGTYIGECDVQFIYAKVSVVVQDGQIVEIDLLAHNHERGAAATGIEQ